MDGVDPAVAEGLADPQAGVLRKPGVDIIDTTVRPGRPNKLRHRLGENAVSLLALPQRLGGALILGDVDQDAPANAFPCFGAFDGDGGNLERHSAVFHAYFDLGRLLLAAL